MRRAAARARASASTADARARRARPTRRRAAAWDGLERWRARELDARRAWGDANEPTTTTRERARARDDGAANARGVRAKDRRDGVAEGEGEAEPRGVRGARQRGD